MPYAAVRASPDWGPAPLKVKVEVTVGYGPYEAIGQQIPGKLLAKVTIHYGDGASDYAQKSFLGPELRTTLTFSHVYENPGTYNIRAVWELWGFWYQVPQGTLIESGTATDQVRVTQPSPPSPPPEKCSPDEVKLTLAGPPGTMLTAYYYRCKKTWLWREQRHEYVLQPCEDRKGTERESKTVSVQRETEVAVAVGAVDPYIVDYVELCDGSGCRKIPEERLERLYRDSTYLGWGIKFTITGDTTVRVHPTCKPMEETWPKEWLGDWSGVTLAPKRELTMEDIGPRTKDEEREVECCTGWAVKKILGDSEGYDPGNLSYVISNPNRYIKSIAITDWDEDWKNVAFMSFCDQPLIVLSAESRDIKPGTKMRLRFPLYTYFKPSEETAGWKEIWFGCFDFEYSPRAILEGEAQKTISAKIQVVTDSAPVVAVVKVNVKSVGTPPTAITATYDETLIGKKTVNSPGIYEIGRVELQPGTYLIRAVATDSGGRTATAEKYFTA